MRIIRCPLLASLVLALTMPSAARAEDDPGAARLDAMAAFLAKAPALAVTADCTYDVVQDSGQKIEFGERRQMTLRGPDRVRVDVTRRDGARRGLVFDGARLTAFDLDQKVYATAPAAGTADAALVHFTRDLKMRVPLRELFAADLPQELKAVRSTARLVGSETVGGVATDHVAFRGDSADVQLWIARTGDPLPQRIVITYRLAGGQPQFAADFSGWNLKPETPDSLFAFTPAAGAEQINILAPEAPAGKPAP